MLSRRKLFTGGASLLAGSALLSMMTRRALADPDSAPRRVVFWYAPEGCIGSHFWPGNGPGALSINAGATMNDAPLNRSQSINTYRSQAHGTWILAPMKPYEADMTLVSGLHTNYGPENGPHRRAIKACLAGGKIQDGSIDQQLGHHLQGEAPFHALYSSLMGQHVNINVSDFAGIVHATNGSLVAPTWNPVTTYNQAFPNGIPQDEGPDPSVNHGLESRLDVLGSVGGQLEMVKNHGGKAARDRLETYLTSIEQLEGQTQALLDSTPPEMPVDVSVEVPAPWQPPDANNPYWQVGENFGPLGKIMIDSTVAALALDRTRVATMQWSASGSSDGPGGQHYQTLDIGLEGNNTQDHHMSHEMNDAKRRNQARVFRWYYTQLAYFVERLRSIPDGEGTLFDSTLIVVCSEFGGYQHSFHDVPCVLIGSGGGVVETGQYIDVHGGGGFRPYSNVMLTLAKGFGMNVDSIGQSDGQIDQLLA